MAKRSYTGSRRETVAGFDKSFDPEFYKLGIFYWERLFVLVQDLLLQYSGGIGRGQTLF
jgi:hypothetical protein